MIKLTVLPMVEVQLFVAVAVVVIRPMVVYLDQNFQLLLDNRAVALSSHQLI